MAIANRALAAQGLPAMDAEAPERAHRQLFGSPRTRSPVASSDNAVPAGPFAAFRLGGSR